MASRRIHAVQPLQVADAYVDFRRSIIAGTTSDNYVAATTLYCPGSSRLRAAVSGKDAVYQLGFGTSPTEIVWGTEANLTPGHYSLINSFDAVRFRSRVVGNPATINIETLTPADLGELAG